MTNFKKVETAKRIISDAKAEAKAEHENVFYDYLFSASAYGLNSEKDIEDILTLIELRFDFYGFASCGICDKRSNLCSVSFWV